MATFPKVFCQLKYPLDSGTIKKSLFPVQSYDLDYLATKLSQFQLVSVPKDATSFATLGPNDQQICYTIVNYISVTDSTQELAIKENTNYIELDALAVNAHLTINTNGELPRGVEESPTKVEGVKKNEVVINEKGKQLYGAAAKKYLQKLHK